LYCPEAAVHTGDVAGPAEHSAGAGHGEEEFVADGDFDILAGQVLVIHGGVEDVDGILGIGVALGEGGRGLGVEGAEGVV